MINNNDPDLPCCVDTTLRCINLHCLIQPAKEDSKDIVSEEKEDRQGTEEGKMETKEVQTAEAEIERAVQKTPKKIRTVQCKVVLLDSTEYSCEVEVRK